MRKELFTSFRLLVSSMAFAIDPVEIDSLINFERGGGFRQQDPCEPEQCAIIYLGHRTGGD